MSENQSHKNEKRGNTDQMFCPISIQETEEGGRVKERTKRPDKPLYVPRALREGRQKSGLKSKDFPCANKISECNSQSDKKVGFKLTLQPNQDVSDTTPRENPDKISKPNNESDCRTQKTGERDKSIKEGETCKDETSEGEVVEDFEESKESLSSINGFKEESCLQYLSEKHNTLYRENFVEIHDNHFQSETVRMTKENNEDICHDHVKDEFNDISLKLESDSQSFTKVIKDSHEESVLKYCVPVETNSCRSEVSTKDFSVEKGDESWETMFDDDGECLNPEIIKELCDITGRIKVNVAKSDYSEYQPYSGSISEEYDNIVELFGFPVEFSTQDLVSAFSLFQKANYTIKWVDDCHALAIFSSPAIANQALQLNHPFVKVRPLSEGIKESKAKARFCARLAEPQRPRPVTSATLARRLVSGALGLKVHTSKEQRDVERNVLREAKERKKLKAKQRQDIWDGIVS